MRGILELGSFFERVQTAPAHRPQSVQSIPSYRSAAGRGDRVIIDRTVEQVIERQKPNGCLFKVKGGFFDLDGFWCVKRNGNYIVERNAPKKMMMLLDEGQKKELNRVRLNARRHGSR